MTKVGIGRKSVAGLGGFFFWAIVFGKGGIFGEVPGLIFMLRERGS